MEEAFNSSDSRGRAGHAHEVAQGQGAASRGWPVFGGARLRTALALAPPERIFVVVGHQAAEVRAAIQTPGIGFIEQTRTERHGPRSDGGCGHLIRSGWPPGDSLWRLPAGASSDAAKVWWPRQQSSGAAGAILTAVMDDPTGYGRVLRDADGGVAGVVEQRAGTPEQLGDPRSQHGFVLLPGGSVLAPHSGTQAR